MKLYHSITEIRAAFYPRSARMLDLEKDEILVWRLPAEADHGAP